MNRLTIRSRRYRQAADTAKARSFEGSPKTAQSCPSGVARASSRAIRDQLTFSPRRSSQAA
jgi:hypothetical protein